MASLLGDREGKQAISDVIKQSNRCNRPSVI